MVSKPAPTDKLRRIARVAEVFTPGAPIDSLDLFGGRMDQVLDVVNTVGQRGQHVMLYGERGVGKTSLANVLSEIFGNRDLAAVGSVKVNCHTNDGYESIWANVFRELSADGNGEESAKPPREPEHVRYALQRVQARTLIVIDELDRLEDDDALSLLADTIKTLSDHSVPVTLVLVGVADSVDELIGDHESVERALTQVHMPRMSATELEEIVGKGLAELGLRIAGEAQRRIARLSEGLPHYTHLLSLHGAQAAIADDRDEIRTADVDRAINLAVQKAQHSIRTAYEQATRSPRSDNLFEEVLLACALAQKGPLGHFTAGAVRGPMSRITGRPVEISKFNRHLNEFSAAGRASVLDKTGRQRRWFYRFRNPLLQPFVILTGLARRTVDEDLVAELQERTESPTAPESSEPPLF
ncbi:MAG: AAA family ATPase [Actinomycetota bacterium]|nr:AAA family ATPase [Actinomycetota bacterium]